MEISEEPNIQWLALAGGWRSLLWPPVDRWNPHPRLCGSSEPASWSIVQATALCINGMPLYTFTHGIGEHPLAAGHEFHAIEVCAPTRRSAPSLLHRQHSILPWPRCRQPDAQLLVCKIRPTDHRQPFSTSTLKVQAHLYLSWFRTIPPPPSHSVVLRPIIIYLPIWD